MYTQVFLGKEELQYNDLGEKNKVIAFSSEPLFADYKSVKGSEFYQSMRTGIKVECLVSMNIYEYYDYFGNDDCKKYLKLLHPITNRLIDYTITRTYETINDSIELTLTRGVENVSS